MNVKNYCPWQQAYELCNGAYTKDQIDEMSFGEIQEIILEQE